LLRLAALFVVLLVVLLAVLAVSWSGANPAGADDGYEPDQQVIADVWTYAQETSSGYDHVHRWFRILATFGVVQEMPVSEAQGYADQHLAARWDPIVTELTNLENSADYEPDAQVVSDVRSYAQETNHGYDHVHRWFRVLVSFGALESMTAAEA